MVLSITAIKGAISYIFLQCAHKNMVGLCIGLCLDQCCVLEQSEYNFELLILHVGVYTCRL